jgi:hypothetical protein
MRRKSSGVAVVAILIGVAVAAVVYIASFGKSGHADAGPVPGQAVAESSGASDAAFALAPQQASSDASEHTAAR